jgi:hypothetical protein
MEKKVKNQDSMGKTNFFISTLPFSPWAVLATRAHTESEFDMLGVHKKLVKYVVHLSKRKN